MSIVPQNNEVSKSFSVITQDIYDKYVSNGYVIVFTKGYNKRLNPSDDYATAKAAYEKSWQKNPTKSFSECVTHMKAGGWIGVILPAGIIALDIDGKKEDPEGYENKLKLFRETIEKNSIAPFVGIHTTNNGIHAIFKAERNFNELISTVDAITHSGLKVTYRAGRGRSTAQLVISPSNDRTWERFVNTADLAELPYEFQPDKEKTSIRTAAAVPSPSSKNETKRVLKLFSEDKQKEILEAGKKLGRSVRSAYDAKQIGGHDDIELAFLGWLALDCINDLELIENVFAPIQDGEGEKKREADFRRLHELKAQGKSIKGAGTWFKILQDNDLSDLLKVCEEYEELFSEPRWTRYQPKLKILGFDPDKPNDFFHYYDGKIRRVKLDEITADIYRLYTQDFVPPKEFTKSVKPKIIKLAVDAGPLEKDDSNQRRAGFYRSGDSLYFNFGKTVLTAHIVDGVVKFQDDISDHPIVYDKEEEKKLYFETRKDFINPEKLKNFSGVTLTEVFAEIRSLVSCWRFGSGRPGFSEIDFLTAFIFLLPFNDLLDWRPILFLQGKSGKGKTHLLDNVICKIYKGFAERLQDPTPFSIVQKFSNSRRIPIIDEFEQLDKKKDTRQRVLSILYNIGSGGTVPRGTVNNDTKDYYIKTLPILSAVTLPPDIRETTKNRLVHFSIEERVKMTPPVSPDLCYKIIACLMENFSKIEKLALSPEYRDASASDRHINNYKYAAAVIELATGKKAIIPADNIEEEREEVRLVYLLKNIELIDSNGNRHKLAEFIDEVFLNNDYDNKKWTLLTANDILRRHWLVFQTCKGADYLVFHSSFGDSTFKKAYPDYPYSFAEILKRVQNFTSGIQARFLGEKSGGKSGDKPKQLRHAGIPIKVLTGEADDKTMELNLTPVTK